MRLFDARQQRMNNDPSYSVQRVKWRRRQLSEKGGKLGRERRREGI